MKIIKQNTFGLSVQIGIPTGVLSGIVERFFELNGSPSYKSHRLLPVGCSEILFNLGNVLMATTLNKANPEISCRQFLVSGIKTGFMDVNATKKMHCIGIRFHVGGMKKLFDISPAELTDNDYELDLLISRSLACNIREKLAECGTTLERFNLLGRLLVKKIIQSEKEKASEGIVKEILGKPFLSINSLEKETGFSRQYLHRVFKSSTGISIKKYQQLNRVSSVLKSLNSKGGNLTDLAYSNGYFDQSHFINDFKQLTGYSPASYLSTIRTFDPDPFIF
ncbi:MAG TPA: helix-turn-helix transcriptional regulator [Ignavibacteriaceae bacterium]|nr:helix-turn-helix transcriptional regulator [Ignavibacteriaceae bacterium]